MEDFPTTRGGIVTPCQAPCKMKLVNGSCPTCKRTKDEILKWRGMSQDQRKEVMRDLSNRSPK